MDNNINLISNDKEDIDKQDLLNYFIIDRISSRNIDLPKYKCSKVERGINTKDSPSQKSTFNKMSTFSLKKIKPKFYNKYIFNEVVENPISASVVNNKKENKQVNNENLNEVSNIKINKIFLNSLKEDKSNNKSIENIESIYKIQSENLSYLFNKSSRESSNNFKIAKNLYNDLIKRKGIIMKKLKLLNRHEKNIFNNDEIKACKNTPTNLNVTEYKKNKNFKINNSKNNSKDLDKNTITSFLNRKKVNDIPLTFPLCLLHKTKYNSISQKNRAENILNKFICLKTHIVNDPENKEKIIKEFILKNTNIHIDELSNEKIENFMNFLKITFSFDPNKSIKEIINDAMNYKINLNQEKINPYIFMRNDFKYNIINAQTGDNKFITNKELKKNNTAYSAQSLDINIKAFADLNNKTFDIKNKKLNVLLQDLENELNEIKNYQLVQYHMPSIKFNKNKNIFKMKNISKNDKKKNKNMDNLCLLNKRLSQKYKSLYKDYCSNSHHKYGLKKSLKKINERMYYKSIRKNLIEEYDTEEIKKKFKLTEYIVFQRARQALLLQKEKEKCLDIMNSTYKIY